MTYEKYFLTTDEIIALSAACSKLPFSRQLTVPWGQLKRHRVVSFSARPSARASYVGPHFTLAEAPQEVQQLAAKLSAHTGKDINYLSVVLYENGNDYMTHHQHREDTGYDAAVYIVSTGAIRPFELRDVATGYTRRFLAEPGSLITMSSAENDTHTHAVPKCKATTPRIAINCKSVGPRVYSCRKGQEVPEGAVYIGRETRDRKTGGILRPDTPYGNHDHLEPEEFRLASMNKTELIQSLRGKDLLCWCTEAKRDLCHARVWLQLANA
jgi:alkylated DNA repair dioxygenase AlkB